MQPSGLSRRCAFRANSALLLHGKYATILRTTKAGPPPSDAGHDDRRPTSARMDLYSILVIRGLGALLLSLSYCAMFCSARGPAVHQGHQPQARLEAFSLALRITHSAGAHSQEIVYKFPHKWRRSTDLAGAKAERVSVSDGTSVWSYDMTAGKLTSIKLWRMREVINKYGAKLSFSLLQSEALDGVLAIGNPTLPAWKHEYETQWILNELQPVGEEKLGETLCVVFKSKDVPRFRIWFGKEDGLLRQQILYDSKGAESTKWSVVRIDTKSEVNDTLFKWEPPRGVPITDETNALMEELRMIQEAKQEP
jgi:outer membrane lipoprotein-sorting protein